MARQAPAEARALIRSLVSEVEEQAWLGLVATHEQVARALDKVLVREHSMSLSSFDALIQIAHAEGGEIAISDLAERILLSPSRVSRLVIEFERQGYVERRRSASDSRSTRAAITTAGRDKLRQAAPAYLTTIRRVFLDQLSEREVKQLARTWERVRANS